MKSGIPINSTCNIEIADGGDGFEIEITGTPKYYAGGGAGGINTGNVNTTIIPQGGLGGGGNGTNVETGRGTEGVSGTGGGGGGSEPGNELGGRRGGSGIVIIRYYNKKPIIIQIPNEGFLNYKLTGWEVSDIVGDMYIYVCMYMYV